MSPFKGAVTLPTQNVHNIRLVNFFLNVCRAPSSGATLRVLTINKKTKKKTGLGNLFHSSYKHL